MAFIFAMAYYLTGFLNFSKEKLSKEDLFFSGIINVTLGSIYYLFNFSLKHLLVFLLLIPVVNLVKFALLLLESKEQNILFVGDNLLLPNLKQIVKHTGKYSKIEYCNESDLEKLYDIVEDNNIGLVIVSEHGLTDLHNKMLLGLMLNGVKVDSYRRFYEAIEGRIDVNRIDEAWLLNSSGFNILHNNSLKRAKRLFDIIASAVILVPAFPIMLLVAIGVKLDSRGPVFFRQKRVGLGGREFIIYKFRSMVEDAEKDGAQWAKVKDTRVTAFGRFIRKTRLDELPQLWNILRGDMSFVGPRPERFVFIKDLQQVIPFYSFRHTVQPGLTGWAQVMYPYGASIEDSWNKLEYDLYYIKHQSIVLDTTIFIKTIKTVLFGHGR
jgi:exopolysaccharide biosynthesis polyprenyl glycosylphosphotransferase